jgi:hypothetical protein
VQQLWPVNVFNQQAHAGQSDKYTISEFSTQFIFFQIYEMYYDITKNTEWYHLISDRQALFFTGKLK